MSVDSIFTKCVWPSITSRHPVRQAHPAIYVLGGQPGAGKSSLHRIARQETQGNIVTINGDEFRRHHPDFERIQQRHGINAAEHTATFSGQMTGFALEKVREESLNASVEGTFRVATTPINTLQAFKAAGYRTEVLLMTCPKDVSWASTLSRYCELHGMGKTSRFTPKPAHDVVVAHLAENAKAVLDSGLVDRMRVYSRDKLLYDSTSGTGTRLTTVVNIELNRHLSATEHQVVIKHYQDMLHLQEQLKAPNGERQAITRQFHAYLLRSEDTIAINQQQGLMGIYKQAEVTAHRNQKPLKEVLAQQAQQLETGSLRTSSDLSR